MSLAMDINESQTRYEANPNTLFFARYGHSLLLNNELEKAVEVCRKGVEEFPAYITGRLILAKCLQQSGDNDGAVDQYTEVLVIDKRCLRALKELGDIYNSQGMNGEASIMYSRVLEMDPLDIEVAENLARTSSEESAHAVEPGVEENQPAEEVSTDELKGDEAPEASLEINDDFPAQEAEEGAGEEVDIAVDDFLGETPDDLPEDSPDDTTTSPPDSAEDEITGEDVEGSIDDLLGEPEDEPGGMSAELEEESPDDGELFGRDEEAPEDLQEETVDSGDDDVSGEDVEGAIDDLLDEPGSELSDLSSETDAEIVDDDDLFSGDDSPVEIDENVAEASDDDITGDDVEGALGDLLDEPGDSPVVVEESISDAVEEVSSDEVEEIEIEGIMSDTDEDGAPPAPDSEMTPEDDAETVSRGDSAPVGPDALTFEAAEEDFSGDDVEGALDNLLDEPGEVPDEDQELTGSDVEDAMDDIFSDDAPSASPSSESSGQPGSPVDDFDDSEETIMITETDLMESGILSDTQDEETAETPSEEETLLITDEEESPTLPGPDAGPHQTDLQESEIDRDATIKLDNDLLIEKNDPPSSVRSDNVATVTLAEIYFNQGLKEQALDIYRQLLSREPENQQIVSRIEEIKSSQSQEPGPPSVARQGDRRKIPRPGVKIKKRRR